MADWTNLPNAAVGVGGLPSGTTVTALRDNPVAIAEGAAGAPRMQTPAIQDSAVTTAKIADANVTTAKLPVGTRSFSGTIGGGGIVSISYSDSFAFVPNVGNNSVEATIRGGAFILRNRDDSSQSYSITWRYLTV